VNLGSLRIPVQHGAPERVLSLFIVDCGSRCKPQQVVIPDGVGPYATVAPQVGLQIVAYRIADFFSAYEVFFAHGDRDSGGSAIMDRPWQTRQTASAAFSMTCS